MTNPNMQRPGEDDPLAALQAEYSAENVDREAKYLYAAETMHAVASQLYERGEEGFAPRNYLDLIHLRYQKSKSATLYEQSVGNVVHFLAEKEAMDLPIAAAGAYMHMGFIVGIDMAQRVIGAAKYDSQFSRAEERFFNQIGTYSRAIDEYIMRLHDAGFQYATQKLAFTESAYTPYPSQYRSSEFAPLLTTLSQGLALEKHSIEDTDLRAGFGMAHIICNMALQNKNGA